MCTAYLVSEELILVFFMLSLCLYLLQNISNKEYGRRYGKGSSAASVLQNGICVCFSALVMALPGSICLLPSAFLLLAALFGCFYLLTVFLLLCAFSHGSMGGSTLLCNIGMFISALYGILVFRDDFTAGIGVGMVCMLTAVVLCTPRGDGTGSLKWFWFALASGVSNGIVASIKSTAVRLGTDLDMRVFLFWGFLMASLMFCMLLLFHRPVRLEAGNIIRTTPCGVLLCGLGSGIGTSMANLFQMRALEHISSAIVYPFTAGFLVVILWLTSLLIYKEVRLRLPHVLSVLLCIAAILFVNT